MIHSNFIQTIFTRLRNLGFQPQIESHKDPIILNVDKRKCIKLVFTPEYNNIYLIKYFNELITEKDYLILAAGIFYKTLYQFVPVDKDEDCRTFGLCKQIDFCKFRSDQWIGEEILKLEKEYANIIIPELTANNFNNITGITPFEAKVSKFIESVDYKNFKFYLSKFIASNQKQLLGIVKGKHGVGKKTSLYHVCQELGVNPYQIEINFAKSMDNIVEDLKRIHQIISKSIISRNRNMNCLIIPEVLSDSLLQPYFSHNEQLLRTIKLLSSVVPVIMLTSLRRTSDIVSFLLGEIYPFYEDTDDIFVGRVVQANYPYVNRVVFDKRNGNCAEPLASIKLTLKNTIYESQNI